MSERIENRSTFRERMQGPPEEANAVVALSILSGDSDMAEAKILFANSNVDWEFVKRYIAEHKHEYPDCKE